jgi:eukaryotic-like serine/threonine-protein kinase
MTEPDPFGPPNSPSPWSPPTNASPQPTYRMSPVAPSAPPVPTGPANPYAPMAAAASTQPAHYPPPYFPTVPTPHYPPVGGSPFSGPARVVRGNRGLGIALLVLAAVLVIDCLLRAATASSAVHRLDFWAARGVDTRAVPTLHDTVSLLTFIAIPLYVVGSIWLYRAQANARAVAEHRVPSLAWAWLGWLVPVAWFFVPKQIVDASWRVTAPLEGARTTPGRPRSTIVWWGLWTTFNVLFWSQFWHFSYASRSGAVPLTQPAGVLGAGFYSGHRGISPGLELAVALLSVAAYAAFVPIVLGLSDAQEGLLRRLRGSGPIPY